MPIHRRTWKKLRSILAPFITVMLALSLLVPTVLAQTPTTPGVPPQSEIPPWANETTQRGVVAVAQPNAARVGAEMLARGGNAIDAGAAIQFALNVEEPMATGIGGGAFIVIYLANSREVVIIDSRERAPAGARPDQFLGPDGNPLEFEDAQSHGNAVGVPGTLMGTATALQRYGTMSLADVMQPAIKLADEGFPVPDYMVEELPDYVWKLSKQPGNAQVFFRSDGTTTLQRGDILVQKDLAKTLRMIADQGIDAFYQGPIGQAIADIVKARGGPMEMSDLQNYEVKDRPPTRGSYRGWEIASMSPPSSGGLTMIQMLMMLERFNIGQMGHNSADTLHAMIEAMHLAYADRGRYMADVDFVPIPQRGLLNPDYVAQRSALINMDQTNPNVTAGDPFPYEGAASMSLAEEALPPRTSGHTTHFSVADRWGNVVSWTTTIEDWYGSGIMVPEYGILLNNELTDFSFRPGVANEVQPFKRPRSSMTPTILFKDGRPWMAVGSPGGATIITTTMQAIMNVVDHGMAIQDAVNAPRIFAGFPPDVTWEQGISPEVRAELARRGHQLADEPDKIGSVQSVIIDLQTGRMYGAGDPRRGGTAISVNEARDGRTLADEPPGVRTGFENVWGNRAYERWAYEHNQAIGQ